MSSIDPARSPVPPFTGRLARYGAKTLVLTGVPANICVETTPREFDSWDHYVVVVKDLKRPHPAGQRFPGQYEGVPLITVYGRLLVQ